MSVKSLSSRSSPLTLPSPRASGAVTPEWLMVAAERTISNPDDAIPSEARLLQLIQVMAAYVMHPMGARVHDRVRTLQVAFCVRRGRTRRAATTIQRAARGRLSRKILMRAKWSATVLQAVWRGHAVAQRIRCLRSAFNKCTKIALLERAFAEKERADKAERKLASDPKSFAGLLVGKSITLSPADHPDMRMGFYDDHGSIGLQSGRLSKEHLFKVVDAGNGMIALHNAAANRFLRLRNNHVDGHGGVRLLQHGLPEDWGAEKFQVLWLGPKVALYSPTTSGRFIGARRRPHPEVCNTNDLFGEGLWEMRLYL